MIWQKSKTIKKSEIGIHVWINASQKKGGNNSVQQIKIKRDSSGIVNKNKKTYSKKERSQKEQSTPLFHVPCSNQSHKLHGNNGSVNCRHGHSNFFYGRRKHINKRKYNQDKTYYTNPINYFWSFHF